MIAAAGSPAVTAAPAGPNLRDIHLPADPSWWPPAPGWWLLAIVLLMLLVVVVRRWRRSRRVRARQQQVLDELEQMVRRHQEAGSRAGLWRDLHQLLRRVARQHDAGASGQQGEAWRQTLQRVPVDAATLHQLLALDQLIYQVPAEGDDEAIVAAVRRWLRLAVKPSNWKSAPLPEARNA
ncbi:MAG: DUF4381 domain-containing protein [Rhodanobacter sp.]